MDMNHVLVQFNCNEALNQFKTNIEIIEGQCKHLLSQIMEFND